MELLLEELAAGVPSAEQIIRTTIRILAAVVLAGVIGLERERTGKSAGLRTHMLVALSSAIFTLSALESGMEMGDVSRVIQGVATGIGFIGAGAILKLESKEHIQGLTTAAGIWLTAAVGIAAGLGRYGLATISVLLGWTILELVARFERGRRDLAD